MKIGIVNDDIKMITALQALIKKEGSHKVIWTAESGQEALEQAKKELPDLLLVDITMPLMSGVELTKAIMQETPTAILIVTSDGKESQNVFKALGEGAIDALSITLEGGTIVEEAKLLHKIQTIGRLKGKIHLFPKNSHIDAQYPRMGNGEPFPQILAIGASTGGPVALSKILSQLPASLPLAIVIVQHVDEKFIGGLARWLEEQTHRTVKMVEGGEYPVPGVVMLASKNQHLVVRHNGTLHYTSIPRDCPYCPSVDVFFHSLSQHWPLPAIAALLTGMGTDGARGLKSLKDKGWHTIAEHEKSCVIYGMPRAAIEAGASEEVVECSHMPAAILSAYRAFARK